MSRRMRRATIPPGKVEVRPPEAESIQTAAEGAEFRELSPEEMAVLLDILKRNKKSLMARKGVFKVDVGYRWKDGKLTGEVAIRVHVHEKKPVLELAAEDVAPEEIEDYPVDVIQSNIELHAHTTRVDPLIGGVETRNVNLPFVGTMGAVVFDATTGAPMALTNNHVFVGNRPNAAVGDQVNQPGTTGANDSIGTVARRNRVLDCAVATINTTRQVSTSIFDYPGGIKGMVNAAIGMRVTKSGRTTETTFGMVEGVSTNEFTVVPIPGQWMELSMGGDSGSIWLETSSHAAVGLHFAGEQSTAPADERAWAKRIERVQNRLNINLRRKATLGDRSDAGPALASLGNTLLLGWVGVGNLKLNFMRTTDGLNFTNKVTLGDTSPASLGLTVFKGKFVVAWIGVGNSRLNIMQSSDGITWGNKVTLGDTSQSAPALAVFGNQLFLAWRGLGNNRLNVMRSSDGMKWSQKVTLSDTTTSGPSLAVLGSQLLLGWRGVGNNQLNVMRSNDGKAFSGKVTLSDTTTARPYLHVHAGRAYVAWQGVGNNRLNVLDSGNGSNWTGKITLRETCTDGPVLGTLGNEFVWGWTGTDSKHRLNTLLYDLRT